MKRYFVAGMALAVTVALLAACGGAPPGAPLKVRIATDATYPPFESYIMPQRTLTGFDIELMQAIATQANLEVEFVNTSLPTLLADVAACQYDGGIAALAIPAAGQAPVLFSDPYFTSAQVVVVKRGNLTVTGRQQLAGLTVGAQAGSPAAAAIAQIDGARLQTYPVFAQAFEDLINGLIGAVVADEPLALSYASRPANQLKIVGAAFAAERYGIALCPQRADLVARINAGLTAVKANGTLDRLQQTWLTGEISP